MFTELASPSHRRLSQQRRFTPSPLILVLKPARVSDVIHRSQLVVDPRVIE